MVVRRVRSIQSVVASGLGGYGTNGDLIECMVRKSFQAAVDLNTVSFIHYRERPNVLSEINCDGLKRVPLLFALSPFRYPK